MGESLTVTGGAQGLRALARRAVKLDPQSLARISLIDDHLIDTFITTPFDCTASRRVDGTVSRDGSVCPAGTIGELVDGACIDLGPSLDAQWPGALPPKTGFVEREIVPVAVVRQLAEQGKALARQFSGPLGPPKSLLNQTVLTVEPAEDGTTARVEIPMRMIFACTSLGLIPGAGAPESVPRHLRVATSGRWIRLDAPYGSVYYSPRLSLFA